MKKGMGQTTKKKEKRKFLCFEPATFHVGGEGSPN